MTTSLCLSALEMLCAFFDIDHARSKTMSMVSGMTGNGSSLATESSRSSGMNVSKMWYGSFVPKAYSRSRTMFVAMGVLPAHPLMLYTVIFID
jgi:hypothetical protein